MLAVVVVTFGYLLFIWVVFFKFRWMRLTPAWGVFSGFFILHLILVPLVGTRFIAPYTTDVRVVRHTVQLTPRLPEPTRVEAVMVKENTPVKKGDTLFVFDKSIYESQARAAQAALVAARQNVKVLEADISIARDSVISARSDAEFAAIQKTRFVTLAGQGGGSQESVDEWTSRLQSAEANLSAAIQSENRAELTYASQIDGVNTSVIQAEEALAQANYYLEQTEMKAPMDGVIVNLQVKEGMVAGIIRAGSIASLIVDEDPYLLAAYRQENLKFVKEGQPVVVALNTHPGEHFTGTVEEIWWASRRGQYLPSGNLPIFPELPEYREVRLPVKIKMDDPDVLLAIGAQAATLIITDEKSPFTWLGQITLRTYTWGRWLYPLPF